MECGVCNEEFNEDDFCPRILQCSHTLCTKCIKQLITKGTKTCPFCRAAFHSIFASDVNINHAFLDLIKYLSRKNSDQQNTCQMKVTPLTKRLDDFKKETVDRSKCLLGSYQEMQILIETLVRDIDESSSDIKDQNVRLKDEIIRGFTEKLKLNEQHADELKTQKHALLDFVEGIKTHKAVLENELKKLDAVNTLKEAGAVVEETEEANDTADGWRENTQESLLKHQQYVESTAKNVNVTKKLVSATLELLKASGRSPEEIDQLIIAFPSMPGFLPPCGGTKVVSFKDLGESQFKTLVRGRRIFAVQRRPEGTRTATITLRNDQIMLHHLVNEPPPQNVCLIEHKDLLSLENPSSRLTFFELGTGETSLGYLMIRLAPDTELARNFAWLCTGEMGPSYAGTNMIKVVDKGTDSEGIRGGDYEFNNGNGGKPLIPGLREALINPEYYRPGKAGTVWGFVVSQGIQFCICTRNRSSTLPLSFGIVEEGLEVLTNAIARFPDIREVKVEDCGAVLSYNN